MSQHDHPSIMARYLARCERKLLDRFWSQVTRGSEDECWLFSGATDESGYGRINMGNFAPRAHRFSYEITNGPIPPGDIIVRHTCDNPPCCNPRHLLLGSKRDNAHDRDSRGRSGVIGTNNHHAKLTEDQVREIRSRWTGVRGQASALMREYGIKGPAFYGIVRRKTWKHVT